MVLQDIHCFIQLALGFIQLALVGNGFLPKHNNFNEKQKV